MVLCNMSVIFYNIRVYVCTHITSNTCMYSHIVYTPCFLHVSPIYFSVPIYLSVSSGKPHGAHELYDAAAGRFGVGPSLPGRPYYAGFHPSKTLRQSFPMGNQKFGTFGVRPGMWGGAAGPGKSHDTNIKPRVITVVRNGAKPRANVKILLNRRSVQSYEQLSKDISEAFGPKWKNNKVRKLFTVKGREVQGVSDFFRDDDIFIAIGNESLTTGDVHDILDELYPDSYNIQCY